MSPSSDPTGREEGRILLLSPPWNEKVDRACLARVTNARPGERDVLVVTYTRPAEAVIDDLRIHLDERLRNLCVIDVEDAMRSATATTGTDRGDGLSNVAVSMADPGDVAALVDAVERFLADRVVESGASVVYVDSVTGMINRIGLTATIGFVDSLEGLLSPDGRAGFFRLDDDAHDGGTLAVLDPLFESVLGLAFEDGRPYWSELASATDGIDVAEAAARSSADRAFDLLAHPRRRLLLHGLRLSGRPVSLPELAAFVADREVGPKEDPSEELCNRIYTGLWHVHLPRLAESGVVAVDEVEDIVELIDPRRVEPYLSLSMMEDLRE